MAKKTTKLSRSIKIKAIVAIIGLILFLTVGIVYAHKNNIDLKVSLGKNLTIGVWWGEHGEPHLEKGRFGCCAPYCKDMFEIECSGEYGYDGTFSPGRCDYDVTECRQGCCLPECKEFPKVQCEGDYGRGGDWRSSQCRDIPDCEIGCCILEGKKIQEKKAPCESTGGNWTKGECKKGYYVDMKSDAITAKSGITIKQHIKYHLYTCSDTVYGLWSGDTNIRTEAAGHGQSYSNTESDDFPLNFKAKNGVINYSQGTGSIKIYLKGKVNESTMTVNFGMPGWGEHYAQGKVQPGASECLLN